jgi:putative drug exporter of the RND superfamily
MNALANFIVKHSKLVLIGFMSLLLLSTVWGFQNFASLKSGGYDNPGADSGVVNRLLQNEFKQTDADVIMVVDFKELVDSPASVNLAKALTSKLKTESGVTKVSSYFSLQQQASLRSTDGKAAYFFLNVDQTKRVDVGRALQAEYEGWFHGARIHVTGGAVINAEINGAISKDLGLAESIAVPVTIILLLFVFGSMVASGLPFLVAIISVLGSFFVLYLSTRVADTSVFAINLVTGLGLGLGIDYALLIVNRFREERGSGLSVSDSVIKSVNTAGRTVFFSGVTVAVVMLSMGFFPQYFLRTFAVVGVAATSFAVLGAIVALPALLNILGDRVNKGKVLKGDLTPKETGAWEKISRFVMRRPLPVLFVVLLALGSLTSLARGVSFGQVDERVLQANNPVVVAGNVLRDRFSGRESTPVEVILANPSKNQLIKYVEDLSNVAHVVRVQSPLGIAQTGTLDSGYAPYFATYEVNGLVRVQAISNVDARTTDGEQLVSKIRALPTAIHYVKVGGSAAVYTDAMHGISDNLGWALLWVAISTMLLIFLFTGSVILPIKAVILNMLSLGATLGFLTWIFQGGNLHWLLGNFQLTGTIDSSSMVMIAVIAFGLSMDYEIFLLSRIKEQHDHGQSNMDSVSYGLQHSGRIITAAALVLAVNFFAFITSGVTIIKMLGIGVAFAILLDATVVRALLVPALMRLFGDANWWAPKWLKKIHKFVGLEH